MSTELKDLLYIGREEHEWNWKDLYNCKLAIMGSNKLSNKQQLLDNITGQINKVDPKAVFRIGNFLYDKVNLKTSDHRDYYNLVEFENGPTTESFIAREFESRRMDFVQILLKLYSLLLKMPRTDFLPLASYQKSIEGPLIGYLRAAEKMEEGETKDWVLAQFQSLEKIEWIYKNGYTYYVDESKPAEEMSLDLLMGIWSFWALTSTLEEPQQMLLVLDIPKKLTDIDADQSIKEIIKQLITYVSSLPDEITLSIILSTETMFPIPELNIRHQLYLNYDSPDFDWRVAENEEFFLPEIIERWTKHSKTDGIWLDMALGEKKALSEIVEVNIEKGNKC
ncbi:hypothetical protein [Bacillus sp. FJAT-29937]|uniref:hypothetical protein n=1 Tax=Bacillus sp. FJAT-29937 TaxID=1720553 RepID=UPI00082D7591|nr:hypothetical protein [Bacillus sp. FJAT-29937]